MNFTYKFNNTRITNGLFQSLNFEIIRYFITLALVFTYISSLHSTTPAMDG